MRFTLSLFAVLAALSLLIAAPALADTIGPLQVPPSASMAVANQVPLVAVVPHADPGLGSQVGSIAVSQLMVPITYALSAMLLALMAFAAAWLRNKAGQAGASKNAALVESVGAKALDIMRSIVQGLQTSMREPMQTVANSGTLTLEQRKQLADAAVAAFQASLSDALKAQLGSVLGVAPDGIAHYAAGLREQALGQVKVAAAVEDAKLAALDHEESHHSAEAERLIAASKPAPAAIALPGFVGEAPKAAKPAASDIASAVKTALVLLCLALGMLWSSTAGAQVTLDYGPSAGFMLVTSTATSPTTVAPKAGYQVSISEQHLNLAILGRSYDVLSTLLPGAGESSKVFGALALGGMLCSMNGLFCGGMVKDVIDTNGGLLAMRAGWMPAFSLCINFGLAPAAPPTGVETGARGLVRGNTLWFGAY